MDETGGLVVAWTVLTLFATVFGLAMTGTLGDLVVWALGAALIEATGRVLVLVALAVVVIGALASSGVMAHSHGNRSRSQVVRHERAHQRALRRAGAGGSRRRVYRHANGTWAGEVRARSPRRFRGLPRSHQAAVYLAGGVAAPGTNCDHDHAAAARILAGASQSERDEAARLAARWAR